MFAGSQAFLAVFQAGLLFLEYLELALDLVEFPVQAPLVLLQFLAARLQLTVSLLLDLQGLLLGVEQGLLLDLLGFADGVFNDLASLQGDIPLVAFHQSLAQVDPYGQSGRQVAQGQKQCQYIQFHRCAPSTLYEKTAPGPQTGGTVE